VEGVCAGKIARAVDMLFMVMRRDSPHSEDTALPTLIFEPCRKGGGEWEEAGGGGINGLLTMFIYASSEQMLEVSALLIQLCSNLILDCVI